MTRKLKKVDKEVIESIVEDSLKRAGIKGVKKEESDILLRLIISGIADYFYNNPDDIIDVGFIRFKKNPQKEELLAVDLIVNKQEGIVNADTLNKYYKGDLIAEEKLKGLMNNFVNELLTYSQSQSNKITSMTSKLQVKSRKGGA